MTPRPAEVSTVEAYLTRLCHRTNPRAVVFRTAPIDTSAPGWQPTFRLTDPARPVVVLGHSFRDARQAILALNRAAHARTRQPEPLT